MAIPDDTMDTLIKETARGLSIGADISDIHDDFLERGHTQDEIFLAIQAGILLHQALLDKDEELLKRKPPFGRSR